MQDLTPKEVRNYLATTTPPPVLLDVREPWEYDTVNLPNSVLLPMQQIGGIKSHFPEDQELIIICHHGVRSMHVARYLESVGFSRIINLKGGIDRWARDLDPEMPLY